MLLDASIYIVFALLLIDCALLLLVVLMQRPKQEGLGAAFGAQMTDQAFGAQTTDVLKKGTVIFGTGFMLLSFVLASLMNVQFRNRKSDLNTRTVEAPVAAQTAPAEATPAPAQPAFNLEGLVEQQEAPAIVTPAPEPTPAAPAATEQPEQTPAEVPAEESAPATAA